jgi:hypothetical protein
MAKGDSKMLGKASITLVVTASLVTGFAALSRAAPAMPITMGPSMGSDTYRISFWGEPYPYGYAYLHNPCVRYFRIETPRGWRWKREWICQ